MEQQLTLFDYTSLDVVTRESLQHRAERIRAYTKRYVLEVGRELVEARNELRHNKTGGFEGWIALEFGWSRRAAYNFISVYESFGNCAKFAQLEIADSALYLLAPASEQARNEAIQRAEGGEKITYTVARNIVDAHKSSVEQNGPLSTMSTTPPDIQSSFSSLDTLFPGWHLEEREREQQTTSGEDWCQLTQKQRFDAIDAGILDVEVDEEEEPYEPTEEDRYMTAIDNGTLESYHDDLRREAIRRDEEQQAKEKRDAHVMRVMGSSESPEWYTPEHIIKLARDFFGGEISLDPCSCEEANQVVRAWHYYSREQDGLSVSWPAGTLWLNPPYGNQVSAWVAKLVHEFECLHTLEALALLPARIDTNWFQPLYAYPMCHVRGRIQYENSPYNAPFPCVVVYLGKRVEDFIDIFRVLGPIMRRIG